MIIAIPLSSVHLEVTCSVDRLQVANMLRHEIMMSLVWCALIRIFLCVAPTPLQLLTKLAKKRSRIS